MTSTQTLTEKTETVAQVRSRQSVWVTWMREATEGLKDNDLVVTLTQEYPFGRYLKSITPKAKGE